MDNSEKIPSMEQIRAIAEFLPVFEREGFVPSTVVKRPGQFSFHSYAPELSQFHHAVYENGFVISFDWPSWQTQAMQYFDEPELLESADLLTLCKLLTLHVRKERFCDGHLAAMVECGHIAAILRRLRGLGRGGD